MSESPLNDKRTKNDYIITQSGKHVYALNPLEEEIDIEDIAHALSMVTRWTGHAPRRASVGLHCIHVSLRAEELAAQAGYTVQAQRLLALEGLLHDASEAYLADVAKPIKMHLANYLEIEAGLQKVIGLKFNVRLEPLVPEVKQADLDLLVTEASVYFPNETWWKDAGYKLAAGGKVLGHSEGCGKVIIQDLFHEHMWTSVKDRFLRRFLELVLI